MKSLAFNFNEYIECKLSERGAQILNDIYSKYVGVIKNYEPKVYKDGDLYKDQFWSFMEKFGPNMSLGLFSPFEGGMLRVTSSYPQDSF